MSEESLLLARTWGEITFAVVQQSPPQGYVREAKKTGCVHYVTALTPPWDFRVYGSNLEDKEPPGLTSSIRLICRVNVDGPNFGLQFSPL